MTLPPLKFRLTALIAAALVPAILPAEEKKTGFERWEKDIAAFEAAERAHPTAPGGIVFLGSSSIRMWKLDKAFPGLPVVNRGFGGSTIPDSIHFSERILFPLKPATVLFYAGDNDSSNGHSADRIFEDFKTFADALHAKLPDARLIFIPIKPSIQRWKLRPLQAEANNRIAAWCAERSDWSHYADTATPLLGSDGKPDPKFFEDDGLHLSPAGYAVWNEVIRPLLPAPAAKGAAESKK